VDPVLAVLDEPTSQLDEAGAELVADALGAAADRGCAVVVASHDPVLLAAADTVVSPSTRDQDDLEVDVVTHRRGSSIR
jgi:ABC-type protease/lipase transport system fused ATPase/permease subunit